MSLTTPYNLLIDILEENYVTKDKKFIRALKNNAYDMVLLLIRLLVNTEVELSTYMREAIQKQICKATESDFKWFKKLITEENERFLEDMDDTAEQRRLIVD